MLYKLTFLHAYLFAAGENTCIFNYFCTNLTVLRTKLLLSWGGEQGENLKIKCMCAHEN